MSGEGFALYLPLLALGLDLVLGDPQGWPHPVRLLGRTANRLEVLARRGAGALRLRGAVCVLALALGAGGAAWGLSSLPLLGWIAALYLAYAGLALGSLLREAGAVTDLVAAGRLPEAREALSMLVSRETADMDEDAVCRSLAETVSENLGDGLAAPFLYLVLGGAGGLWAYKAVSTLDSMWGYRTERWRELGWAAARADDVLAWIPSRLAGLALWACGGVMRRRWAPLSRVRADAARTESPNAGWPMAAAAWAMGARVGGPATYFGELKDKPVLGPEDGRWDVARLRGLLRLVRAAGLACALATWGAALALG
ncbi:adenosylcobinamide-phosphate synthase CbiB [Desulfocurvus sp. DL9XJH121]